MTNITRPRFTYYKSKDGNRLFVLDEGMLLATASLSENDKISLEISTNNELLETEHVLADTERLTDEELIILLQTEQWSKAGEILGGAIEALKSRLESVIQMNQQVQDDDTPSPEPLPYKIPTPTTNSNPFNTQIPVPYNSGTIDNNNSTGTYKANLKNPLQVWLTGSSFVDNVEGISDEELPEQCSEESPEDVAMDKLIAWQKSHPVPSEPPE